MSMKEFSAEFTSSTLSPFFSFINLMFLSESGFVPLFWYHVSTKTLHAGIKVTNITNADKTPSAT